MGYLTSQQGILKHLFDEDGSIFEQNTVALVGDHGVGKTYIAREICEYVNMRNSNSKYVSLWLSLNKKKYDDDHVNYEEEEEIARQLSIIDAEYCEDDDDDTNNIDIIEDDPAKDLSNKVRKKIENMMMISSGRKESRPGILLTLDDVPPDTRFHEEIISKVKKMLPAAHQAQGQEEHMLKILITGTMSMPEYVTNRLEDDRVTQVHLFCRMEWITNKISELLDKRGLIHVSVRIPMTGNHTDLERQLTEISIPDQQIYVLLILQHVPHGITINFEEIISGLEVLKRLKQRNLLKVILLHENDGQTFPRALIPERMEEVIEIQPLGKVEFDEILRAKKLQITSDPFIRIFLELHMDKETAAVAFMMADVLTSIGENDSRIAMLKSFMQNVDNHRRPCDWKILSLMQYVYGMLPSENVTMRNCIWHSRELFLKHGSIHYNELITYWIMEGYLDFVDHIEEAYEEGHRLLMELDKRRALKLQQGELVVMERVAMDVVHDPRRNGVGGTASLGLDLRIGRVQVGDGMIKTPCNDRKQEKVYTLLMDGSRLCREVPDKFFKPMKGLKVLVLLKPMLKSLEFLESVLKLEGSPLSKLRVLVLRSCDMLENIDHVKKIESLEVLEISGATSLKEIPDEVFAKMPKLRSLNLSALPIKYLPPSFSKLTQLHWLILRDCSCLEQLPSLEAFKSLEVVDLSGAYSLTKFEDKRLDCLPEINLQALTQSSLEGCGNELPILKTGNVSSTEISIDFLPNEGLRILDMSKTKISRLPLNLSNLTRLEFLDLSYVSCSDEIEKINFANLKCLHHLNLSNTKITTLQSLSHLHDLRELLLRDCQLLEELPLMKGLCRLEMLDLSGACSLRQIPYQEWLSSGLSQLFHCLRHLNLSGTMVKFFPPLSDRHVLCELLLRDCKSLKELPKMEGLKTLEKLDLSGCCLLEWIPDGATLSQMRNLRQLLLSNCVKLRKLPVLGALEKLEVLNLSGCSALTAIEDTHFGTTSLQQLNLSETKIKLLPSLSTLVNLRQLLLRNCINLEELPSLESLTNMQELDLCGANSLRKTEAKFLEKMTQLQILDLSETQLTLPPMLMLGTNLRQLSLRNCSSLKQLPLNQLEKFIHLETLDLSGITVDEFPYCVVSNLIHLKRLHLPDLNGIQQLDWGRIKRLPDDLNWDECGIFANADIHTSTKCPSLTVSDTKIFHHLLNKESKIWDKCFKGFHISVCSSSNISREDELFFSPSDESILHDIHFKTLSCPKEQEDGSVEIRGFDEVFPADVEEVLKRAVYIFLTENKFIKILSDLGNDNMAAMKGLWLENCANMDSIFCENEDIIKLDQSFEILWVSNLVNLKSLYRGNVQVESFKNLKQLHLDCCPKLVNVFSPQQLPENLEILQIKFCCELKSVFQPNSADSALHKLRELQLVELPEFISIGVRLPSIQSINIRNCPNLEGSDWEDNIKTISESLGLVENTRIQCTITDKSPYEDEYSFCMGFIVPPLP